MGLMRENMCLLKNRSINAKHIIMNLSVNLRMAGNLAKTVISLLPKTFYLCFIIVTPNHSVQNKESIKNDFHYNSRLQHRKISAPLS